MMQPTDLVLYGVAQWPDDDTSSAGGAIDQARRPLDTQMTEPSQVRLVSDGTDTRSVTVRGRLVGGAVNSEEITLTSTTPVTTTGGPYERILDITLASASGSRTVTATQVEGSVLLHTFRPNETFAAIFARNSTSSESTETYYEAFAWRNNHSVDSLLTAEHTLTANPSGRVAVGIDTAKGGSSTVSNRRTAPSGITFVGVDTAQSVPTGTLAAGEYVRVWMRLTNPADASAIKTTFTVQLSGTQTGS